MDLSSKLVSLLIFLLLAEKGKCKKRRREHGVLGKSDNADHKKIAFSVGLLHSIQGHKQTQPGVVFDNMLLNIGNCFDINVGVFTAPRDGVFEFTFSGVATPNKKLSLQLMKNNYEVQVLAYDGNQRKHHNVQKQNVLLELKRGDRIWIHLPHRKDYGLQGSDKSTAVSTMFSGRLLQNDKSSRRSRNMYTIAEEAPRTADVINKRRRRFTDNVIKRHHNKENVYSDNEYNDAIAFSAACTMSVFSGNQSEPITSSRYVTTMDGRVKYDKVFVNSGGALNQQMGVFTAPLDGVYYFAFTVGKYPEKKLSVALMKNNLEFQVLIYNDNETRFREMQSQSVMLQLAAGDTICLKSYTNQDYALYSNLGNYITFTGYLVFAT